MVQYTRTQQCRLCRYGASVLFCLFLIFPDAYPWTTSITSGQSLFQSSLFRLNSAPTVDASTETNDIYKKSASNQERVLYKLQGKLLKKLRQTCRDYNMLQEGDHIMVCASGGKDSATLLHLLTLMQAKLRINFRITAVHVNQNQPGYNGTSLVEWLAKDYNETLASFDFKIVDEDTYSIVVDKTAPGKSYCTVCSRLRRGILYSTALELGCNKIALGHHADDCLETLMLNMVHGGQMKAMPARYTSSRGKLAVLRPLMNCFEEDIAEYAVLSGFPILPCNLCSNQANLQRPQVKLLLSSLQGLTPTAKQNMLQACQTVKPSHLLDQNLREACGMDPITGEEENDEDQSI